MTERLSEESLGELEAALSNIESEYRPTCESASYGSGCPGPTDETRKFWRLAAHRVPALIAELRHLRSRGLSGEDVEALRFAVKVVGASEYLFSDRLSDPRIKAHVEQCGRALSVLARLVGES